MEKCLVTKLNGSSDNSELMRVGEMRIKISRVESPTDLTQGLSISVSKPVTLEIIGDGYFTDKNFTENKGKTLALNTNDNSIWVSNNDLEIAILDKYNLTQINKSYAPTVHGYGNNKGLIIDDLKYSLGLTNLSLPSTQVSGDIANLKNLTALVSLDLSSTQVSGDIEVLNGMLSLTNISLKNKTFTGDLSKIPDICKFVSFANNINTVLSWTNRPSTAYILAIEGNAKITDVDKMLQDQAQCQIGYESSSPIWHKRIQCVGNRTAASDAAVETLQSKGYTVSITPA